MGRTQAVFGRRQLYPLLRLLRRQRLRRRPPAMCQTIGLRPVPYQAGDWWETLDSMTLIRRIDPGYQGATSNRVFESHVGLAAEAIAPRNLDKALEHLNAASRSSMQGRVAIHAALPALLAPGT